MRICFAKKRTATTRRREGAFFKKYRQQTNYAVPNYIQI